MKNAILAAFASLYVMTFNFPLYLLRSLLFLLMYVFTFANLGLFSDLYIEKVVW